MCVAVTFVGEFFCTKLRRKACLRRLLLGAGPPRGMGVFFRGVDGQQLF